LMDVQMPGLDGIQTAKLIKERRRNRHIPIIFLTAIHKDPAYIFRGYKEGAVDYLLKPFDPEILRAKVSVFVDLWRKNELLRQQEAMLRARDVLEVEKRGELRFRVLTDSMPQCVWAAGPDGEIYYCNRVWREYAGDDAGMTFFDAVPEEDTGEVRRTYRAAIRSGQPMDREQRLRRKDGEWRWHLCRLVPERDDHGRIMGWICTATDIDQQKRIEEANRLLLASESEARKQAEVANRTKDEFLATVSHELRPPLNAIPDRLQQVVWNLLTNAIKFTPKDGRVELRIERVRSDLRISVSDTGVGIAPSSLDHVFDRFWQADSSITRASGGLGLGLAIVRHLVEVHGGTVRAESEGEGKGARFTVLLPLRAVAPASEPERPSSEAEPRPPPRQMPAEPLLEGLDVLVVDDELDARDLIAAVLKKCGAHVRTAASVDEAVALVHEHRPDVLLSDIGLTNEAGL